MNARGLCRATTVTFALALTLLGQGGVAHAQDDASEKRYREIIRSAVTEFHLGQWQEAIVLFREAHQLRPSPRTHRGLGQALFEARDYVQAIPHLEAALTSADTFEPEQRRVLERALAQARSFVGEMEFVVQPEGASVSVDGRAVVGPERTVLNPGEHTITVRAAGHTPFQQHFVVEGGRVQTMQVQLVPTGSGDEGARAEPGAQAPPELTTDTTPPPSAGDGGRLRTTLGFVAAGLSAASFGTALVLWRVREGGPVEDWETNNCKNTPVLTTACTDARDSAGAEETAIVVASIAGGLLAATAITLFVLPDNDERAQQANLRCGVGPGALLCRGTF